MRSAPPLSVRAGGGALWRIVRAGVPSLAAAVAVHWLLERLGASAAEPALPAWAPLGALGALAAAAAIGALAWRLTRTGPAELAWDGRRWAVDGRPGRLDVMIDLQRWLLLRLVPAGGARARWIAVQSAEAGPLWPRLRATLHAAPLQADPSADAPGPEPGDEPAAGSAAGSAAAGPTALVPARSDDGARAASR